MDDHRPAGIKVYAMILIIGSLLWALTPLARPSSYLLVFSSLPHQLAIARYGLSVANRLCGLALGVGLLYRREFCRRIATLLFYFAIATMAWRHPFEHFLRQPCFALEPDSLISRVGTGGQLPDTLDLARVTYVVLVVAHICFAASFILYFARPAVKKHFR